MSELFKTVKKTLITTPDGVEHASAQAAQKHLLGGFFAKSAIVEGLDPGLAPGLADYVLANKSGLLAIIGKAPRKARAPKVASASPSAANGKKK